MDLDRSARRFARCAAAAVLVAGLGACSTFGSPASLAPGTSIADARQSRGGPTSEYALPGGGTRLEFRQGSFGRETYMLDFNAGGRLVSNRQVLTPQTFATIQPGMSQDDVLVRIGRPAFVFPVGWQRSQIWNYRFGGLEGDCVVFQVAIRNDDHRVSEAGQNTDPACDHASERS